MDKFLEVLNSEAENLANEYLNEDDVDRADVILKEIDLRLSILAHAQALQTSSITADFTQQMQEQMKNVDFSNVDFNNIIKQMGNMYDKP